MKKSKSREMVVGLDIGTSKTVAMVAEITPDDRINIIGVGVQPSKSLREGVVIDIDSTVNSIQRAVEEAELMAGCYIHAVFLSIDGSHIYSFNSHGIVAVHKNEVNARDVERVLDAAKAVSISAECRLLHLLPQEYTIDKHQGVKDPIGVSGVRLEANVHLICCAINAKRNLESSVMRSGLLVDQTVLNPLASSYSVLTENEKDMGVCLVDIGAGATDIIVFTQGAVRYTNVIPIAGQQITKDIATAFRTSIGSAEALKIKNASVNEQAEKTEPLVIPRVGAQTTHTISPQLLCEVVCSRCEELLGWINTEIRRSGLKPKLLTGVVLTGGTAKLDGLERLAKTIFKLPVRVAGPRAYPGLSQQVNDPQFSSAVGLLEFGAMRLKQRREAACPSNLVWLKAKQWLKEF